MMTILLRPGAKGPGIALDDAGRGGRLDGGEVQAGGEVGASDSRPLHFVQTQVSQGSRMLIFSQFTQMLDLIRRSLTESGIETSLLTGKTADRQERCDQFESGKTNVFLIISHPNFR